MSLPQGRNNAPPSSPRVGPSGPRMRIYPPVALYADFEVLVWAGCGRAEIGSRTARTEGCLGPMLRPSTLKVLQNRPKTVTPNNNTNFVSCIWTAAPRKLHLISAWWL